MRASLIVSGGVLAITGVVLFVALAGDAWLVLIAGGAVISVAGYFLPEVTERVEPPTGSHFCPFCSTLVVDGTERCPHCNGRQEWVEKAAAPARSG